jgi:hypothetical protein
MQLIAVVSRQLILRNVWECTNLIFMVIYDLYFIELIGNLRKRLSYSNYLTASHVWWNAANLNFKDIRVFYSPCMTRENQSYSLCKSAKIRILTFSSWISKLHLHYLYLYHKWNNNVLNNYKKGICYHKMYPNDEFYIDDWTFRHWSDLVSASGLTGGVFFSEFHLTLLGIDYSRFIIVYYDFVLQIQSSTS